MKSMSYCFKVRIREFRAGSKYLKLVLASSLAFSSFISSASSAQDVGAWNGTFGDSNPSGAQIAVGGDSEIYPYLGDWSLVSSTGSSSAPDFFSADLPPCSDVETNTCIVSVSAKQNSQKNWSSGSLSTFQLQQSPDGLSGLPQVTNTESVFAASNRGNYIDPMPTIPTNWPSDLANDLPAGGVSSVWNLANASHVGGADYLVRINITGSQMQKYKYPNIVNSDLLTKNFLRILSANIIPISGNVREDFPNNTSFKVQVRLGSISNGLWGWFSSRSSSPTIDFTPGDNSVITLSGTPVNVPVGITPSVSSDQFKQIIDAENTRLLTQPSCTWLVGRYDVDGPYGCFFGVDGGNAKNLSGTTWWDSNFLQMSDWSQGSSNQTSTTVNNYVTQLGGLKTYANESLWSFSSSSTPSQSGYCQTTSGNAFTRGFVGLVASNSSVLSTAGPTWDPVDQSFNYQVSSPHANVDGSPNVGDYSLVIPLSQAQCRWGNTLSNAKATIQVIGDDQSSKIITSVFRKDSNFLYFDVAGFRYSNPKIKIRLTSNISQTIKKGAPTNKPKQKNKSK